MNHGQLTLKAEIAKLKAAEKSLMQSTDKMCKSVNRDELLTQIYTIRVQVKECEACLRMLDELDCLAEPRTDNDLQIIRKQS